MKKKAIKKKAVAAKAKVKSAPSVVTFQSRVSGLVSQPTAKQRCAMMEKVIGGMKMY